MSAVCARLRAFTVAIALIGALGACSQDRQPAAAAAAVQGPYLAMARGQVDVEGGIIRIVAPRDGRIDAIKVEEGDAVRQGDVLAVLDQRQSRSALAIAEANLGQAQAQAEVLKARVAPATRQAERSDEAASAGAASGQSADEAKAALDVLQAKLGAGEAAVKVARAQVAQTQAEIDAQTINAPAAGRIVRRSVHVGDAVSAQAASELFELLPDRPRIVRAELNETYVDKIKPGMQADVVRDSDEGAAVSAHVIRVGEVFGPSRLTDDPVERAGAHDVECVLQLEGGDLRIGQRVLVKFKGKG